VPPHWRTIWQFKKLIVPAWHYTSIPGNITKRHESMLVQDLHTNVPSCIIHDNQKVETTQMSINWWTGRKIMGYHTMAYYSDIKSNEALVYATMWINLENIKRSHIWFHLYEMFRLSKFTETESRLAIAKPGALLVNVRCF
jgi:hypothetical protein